MDAARNVSDPSNTATATVLDTTKPTTPGNLAATAGTGQVALTWQASTDDVGVTGYRVYRGTTQIATLGASAHSHTDTGLAPGPYSYTVRAIDAARNLSDPSNTATATVPDTTAPTVPQNLTARSALEAGGPHVAGLDRQRRRHGLPGVPRSRWRSRTSVPPVFLHEHECPPRATQLHGACPRRRRQPIRLSNTATVTVPDTNKPAAPTNLDATANGSTQVNLTWDASTDDVAVTGYRVYRDGTTWSTVSSGTSSSDVVLPGTYTYEVRAVDAADNLSDPSNADTVTLTPLDLEAPTRRGT